MNIPQKIISGMWTVIIAWILYYPPWIHLFPNGSILRLEGHSLFNSTEDKIDITTLGIRILFFTLIFGFLWVLFRKNHRD